MGSFRTWLIHLLGGNTSLDVALKEAKIKDLQRQLVEREDDIRDRLEVGMDVFRGTIQEWVSRQHREQVLEGPSERVISVTHVPVATSRARVRLHRTHRRPQCSSKIPRTEA